MPKTTTKELVPFQPMVLVTAASQLTVTLKVDAEALREEVERFTDGFTETAADISALSVTSDTSYQRCIDLRNDCGKREAGLTALWDRYKKPLNAARTVVLDMEHQTVDPVSAAKAEATRKGERYLNDQKRAKREADEALARVAKVQKVSLSQQAEDLMAQGFVREAERLERQAHLTVAAVAPEVVPVATGARTGTKYTGNVVDFMAVLRAIVEGQQPLEWEVKLGDARPLVVIDETVLRAMVLRHQKGLNFPGIVVEEGSRISSVAKK